MTAMPSQSIPVRPRRGGPEGALAYLYIFRRVVVGLALLGAGVGWAAQVPWLFAAGLCIAGGELLETSYYIGVLRWGARSGQSPWPSQSADQPSAAAISG